jgi:hypothetical protein
MSLSIDQVAQALAIFNINDDTKSKVLAVLNIGISAQSVSADKPKTKKVDTDKSKDKAKKVLTDEQKKKLEAARAKAAPSHAARNACWKIKKAAGMEYKAFLAFWKALSADEKKAYSPATSSKPSPSTSDDDLSAEELEAALNKMDDDGDDDNTIEDAEDDE